MVEAEENALNTRIEEQVRRILDVYDRARENIDANVLREVVIPTIVVIGLQSHGKSSVLENIARIALPKGRDTVTRTPLELKLRRRPPGGPDDHDYAIIRHKNMPEGSSRQIDDLDQIEAEIRKMSDEITGGVAERLVDIPIYLTIYRLNQIDLTMIDLPGLKYFQEGDASNHGGKPINEVIVDIWRPYITNDNAVILLTIQATSDDSTSQAVQIARMEGADPQGKRTLTVITKVDKLNANEQISVKTGGLGFVCVRNRTDEDQANGVTIDEARQRERDFFRSRADLVDMPNQNKGLDSLIDRLVSLQRAMVLDNRFKFKEQLALRLKSQQQIVSSMEGQCATDQERQAIFKDCLSNWQRDLEELSNGKYNQAGREREMRLRARLDEVLKQHWAKVQKRFQLYQEREFYEKLEKLLKPYSSVHLPNVLDYGLVYQLIEQEWSEILLSSTEIIGEVKKLCQDISLSLLRKYFSRFQGVLEMLEDKTREELGSIERQTIGEVTEMVNIEKSSVYLSKETEPEFERYFRILKKEQTQTLENLKEMAMSGVEPFAREDRTKESYKVNEMRTSIHSYMLVAFNRFVDQSHMWILQNFVNEYKDCFYRQLDQEFSPNAGTSTGDEVRTRMIEKPQEVKRRADALTAIRKLNQSIAEIDTVNRN